MYGHKRHGYADSERTTERMNTHRVPIMSCTVCGCPIETFNHVLNDASAKR